MDSRGFIFLFLAMLTLSACASVPTGPSVMVWPAPGKPFEVFQSDDMVCRQWASSQVGAKPGASAGQALAGSAAVGTALGAGLGAAIGAATGQFGAGLGIGAASGAIMGTAAGAGPASGSQWEIQRRYDNSYLQCMYLKGNQVPGAARTYRYTPPSPRYSSPPPPPPPPGAYPPGSPNLYPPPPPGKE